MDSFISRQAESHLEARNRRFYSDEDVEKLCHHARLSSHVGPVVSEALERAAQEWFENSGHEAVDVNQTEGELVRLSKAAREFSAALNETGRDAWGAMIDASTHGDIGHFIQLNLRSQDELVSGPIEIQVDDFEQRRFLPDMSVSDLRLLVARFRELSIQSRFDVGRPGRGRPESHSLKRWVWRMHRFWVRELEMPFRAGHMKGGDATTPSCKFCMEAFKILDPDIPPQRIHTEMRNAIKIFNQSKSSQ